MKMIVKLCGISSMKKQSPFVRHYPYSKSNFAVI